MERESNAFLNHPKDDDNFCKQSDRFADSLVNHPTYGAELKKIARDSVFKVDDKERRKIFYGSISRAVEEAIQQEIDEVYSKMNFNLDPGLSFKDIWIKIRDEVVEESLSIARKKFNLQ